VEQLDLLFDPVFQEEQFNTEMLLTNQYVDSIQRLDKEQSYEAIISVLWNTGMPCSDLNFSSNSKDKSVLRYCEWKGKQVPCAAIFSTFPTDQGMCCTFNMKAADKFFSGKTYSGLIQRLQNKERYSVSNVNLEKENTEPGRNKGLFVVLDSHSDIMTASSIEKDTQGFIGLITQGGHFPQINVGAFDIKPGHKNIVALSATVINSGVELQTMNSSSRNCIFEWENSFLKIFKSYTKQNCIFECNLFYAQQYLENEFEPCIPWFFPSSEMSPNVCDPWQASRMNEIMSNVPIKGCKDCLPDCDSTIFKTRISAAPIQNCELHSINSNSLCNTNGNKKLNSEHLSDFVSSVYNKRYSTDPYFYKKNFPSSYRKTGSSLPMGDVFESTNKPYYAFGKDIASVEIFFDSAYATKIQRSSKMSWIDYFSSVGGIFGLVLGVGIISLFEIIWLLI
jgi:hypothetical protein